MDFNEITKIKGIREDLSDLVSELSASISILEESEDSGEFIKQQISDILEKAEQWDYGIKGYRNLETKQDLIDAIRKEVINEN